MASYRTKLDELGFCLLTPAIDHDRKGFGNYKIFFFKIRGLGKYA